MTVAEEIEQEVMGWLKADAAEALEQDGRERVRLALDNWLMFTARKRPVPDLPKRLEQFRKQIEVLAEYLTIEIGSEGYVVKTVGDAESTLRQLKRGTDWFDPASDVTEMILGAIFEQSS